MWKQERSQRSREEKGDDARRGPQPPFAALNLSKVRPESRHFHVFHIARVGSVSLLHTGICKPSLRAIGRLSRSLTNGEVPPNTPLLARGHPSSLLFVCRTCRKLLQYQQIISLRWFGAREEQHRRPNMVRLSQSGTLFE